jgi:hypothetical protein
MVLVIDSKSSRIDAKFWKVNCGQTYRGGASRSWSVQSPSAMPLGGWLNPSPVGSVLNEVPGILSKTRTRGQTPRDAAKSP